MLSKEEKELYRRQITIGDWGIEGQEKLKDAGVFVAGAGGLGSAVLYYLAVAGVGNITLCDVDDIELSNLNRQILHTHKNIGMPKADSAAMTLSAANPFITITKVRDRITEGNAEALVGTSDIMIDCLDNHETRHVLNRVSVASGIPMVHAGVSDFHGQITFIQSPDTPCLACFYPLESQRREVPVVGCTPAVLGSLEALEALKYITGIGETLKGKLLLFDGLATEFYTMNLEKAPGCRVCGGE
jgi:adenylyltransferase/sulfurtransferase